jgi:hypothetical protein
MGNSEADFAMQPVSQVASKLQQLQRYQDTASVDIISMLDTVVASRKCGNHLASNASQGLCTHTIISLGMCRLSLIPIIDQACYLSTTINAVMDYVAAIEWMLISAANHAKLLLSATLHPCARSSAM